MITAEKSNLCPVKVLISNSLVHLELFEDKEGNLYLSSLGEQPEGVVYYATTPSVLRAFMEGSISLQILFNETPSLFAEVTGKDKTALYSLRDIDVMLKNGDKTLTQLMEDA